MEALAVCLAAQDPKIHELPCHCRISLATHDRHVEWGACKGAEVMWRGDRWNPTAGGSLYICAIDAGLMISTCRFYIYLTHLHTIAGYYS